MSMTTRGFMSGAIAVIALAGATELRAQERAAGAGDGVVVVDATRGRSETLDEGQKIGVRVRNTIAPSQSVIVSIISPTRPEYVLGVLRPGETKEWLIDTRLYMGGLEFLATSGPSGVTIRNGVSAVGLAKAYWNLGINLMRYERRERADTDATTS